MSEHTPDSGVGHGGTPGDDLDEDAPLEERVEQWLAREMPIIKMHGGTSAVRKADPDDGEVVVELGGGCSGCDVADITSDNIEAGLVREFSDVKSVSVRVPDPDMGVVHGGGSIMGVDHTEGGRGDWGGSDPNDRGGDDHL
jgi:Fe/S biogenesis protein NfuA